MRKIYWVGIGVIIFLSGMIVDRFWLTQNFQYVGIVHEDEGLVPVLNITSIKDGFLRGEVMQGDLRVVAGANGGESIDGKIEVDLGEALMSYETNLIPEGAQFIGSKNSSKYHPISSNAARQILPKNRIYFTSAEEAERAGYTPAND